MSAFFYGCMDDEPTFGDVIAPSNLTVTVDVAQDNSGNVIVTPTAEDAINFHVIFDEGATPVVITPGQTAENRYSTPGEYQKLINVIAYGRGGVSSSTTVLVDLDVIGMIPQDVLQKIAGDGSKNWIWDSSNAGHFGVGDPAVDFPNFFSAGANELNPCLYDDVLTFAYDENSNYNFSLSTEMATFINWAEIKRFFPDATPQEFADECRDINDQIDTETSFVIIENETGTMELTVTNSTLSYWSGAMTYTITELTNEKLVVRGIQEPFAPTGNPLAWYHTFVPQEGNSGGGGNDCTVTTTGEMGIGNNDVLIWSDEFDIDGLPCSGNWRYDLGSGNAGWGNGEEQFYTDRLENARVEDGKLIITAKAENFSGASYTSARIRTQDNFEFKYGKVEFRAKLPTGAGTWPAMWMLGADLDTNPWPAAGEIDVMEHVGNQQNRIFSTLHFPGNSGGDAIGSSTTVPGVSDDFHIYAAEWSAEEIRFSVDGAVFYVFPNNTSLPFNKDFFLIMNVAMGGNFGGNIDPNFVDSTLEVDYVRVYQ